MNINNELQNILNNINNAYNLLNKTYLDLHEYYKNTYDIIKDPNIYSSKNEYLLINRVEDLLYNNKYPLEYNDNTVNFYKKIKFKNDYLIKNNIVEAINSLKYNNNFKIIIYKDPSLGEGSLQIEVCKNNNIIYFDDQWGKKDITKNNLLYILNKLVVL